ncbi:MAG: GxxExxY protein [Pyrinomonadaceae bacterium]|nr:GxxExxY protein [Phycisphaerales bacterium]
MRKADVPVPIDNLSRQVIGCALEVHSQLGPGLLESLYETALEYELNEQHIAVQRQIELVVPYKKIMLKGQRLDLLVGGSIIVELKSISSLAEIHTAQLLSYLRAADKPVGLLFNFNTVHLRDAIKRVFNERWSGLRSSTTPSSYLPSLPSPPSR